MEKLTKEQKKSAKIQAINAVIKALKKDFSPGDCKSYTHGCPACYANVLIGSLEWYKDLITMK